MEGDGCVTRWTWREGYFYPRPPGGGRQATPSKTAYWHKISIHALRVEGDHSRSKVSRTACRFLSTPSGWRATGGASMCRPRCVFLSTPSGWRATGDRRPPYCTVRISIHALRVEGDSGGASMCRPRCVFLSTPSGWRATLALKLSLATGLHFYPRPPGGGRRGAVRARAAQRHVFLSTPSGWRATSIEKKSTLQTKYFYPRPPGGGRPKHRKSTIEYKGISIHALRVEGDRYLRQIPKQISYFYPRPPGGGRLKVV